MILDSLRKNYNENICITDNNFEGIYFQSNIFENIKSIEN